MFVMRAGAALRWPAGRHRAGPSVLSRDLSGGNVVERLEVAVLVLAG
jgi:hypothetical protein